MGKVTAELTETIIEVAKNSTQLPPCANRPHAPNPFDNWVSPDEKWRSAVMAAIGQGELVDPWSKARLALKNRTG